MTGYLSITTVKGHEYFRLVKSQRIDGHVKHIILKNWGSHQPTDVEVATAKVSATKKQTVSATLDTGTLDWESEIKRWKMAKKRFEGLKYAYITFQKGERPKDSRTPIENWDDVPSYGDRVEIVHRYRYTCKVRRNSYENTLLYINLSPNPPENVSATRKDDVSATRR